MIHHIVFSYLITKIDIFVELETIKNMSHDNINDQSIYDIQNELFEKYNIFGSKKYNFNSNIIQKIINILSNDTIIYSKNIMEEIFIFCINNENLTIIKDYSQYYLNKILSEWIVNLSNTNTNIDKILDGNYKINSYLDIIVKKSGINNILNSNLYAVQTNFIINDLVKLNYLIKSKQMLTNIISTNILTSDLVFNNTIESFDVIFFNFPSDVRNMIHASCCQKIKKLKIRGTKSEPLLLQLVMKSLNKNGKAIVIVPDSLLYSDASQPIETRKYLLDNYNIKKIVQINEQLYHGEELVRDLKSQTSLLKNSIIYFENNGSTKSIEFSKIYLKDNIIYEDHLLSLDASKVNDISALYYKLYLDDYNPNTNNKLILEYKSFDDLFILDDTNNIIENQNNDYLVLNKYYKNDDSINYCRNFNKLDTKLSPYFTNTNNITITNTNTNTIINTNTITNTNTNIYITQKENISLYYSLYYLKHILITKTSNFTKGKMNQFDINKIKTIQIPIIDTSKQLAVTNYLTLSSKIMDSNYRNIKLYEELKNSLIETLPKTDTIELSKITNINPNNPINPNNTIYNKPIISILKNSLSAGTVNKYNNTDILSNNSYYILPNNENFKEDYIYYYLKYNENNLKNTAQLSPQPNLSLNYLSSYKIPNIDLDNQINIINYCKEFDNNINKYELENETIKNKDIMSIISKLYNL